MELARRLGIADRPLAFRCVHANTLACRLRTIRRLLGGDPARGDLRLTVELALKLSDLPRLSG